MSYENFRFYHIISEKRKTKSDGMIVSSSVTTTQSNFHIIAASNHNPIFLVCGSVNMLILPPHQQVCYFCGVEYVEEI